MSVHPYYGPGNAVVDTCGDCLLVWLDHSELSVIVTAPA
jgi:Zn-finger nucleic acid-binding protein